MNARLPRASARLRTATSAGVALLLTVSVPAALRAQLPTPAGASPEAPRIVSLGRGTVLVAPARAVVFLAIGAEDASAAIAAAANAALRTRVIDTLVALGYLPDSIQPIGYAVGIPQLTSMRAGPPRAEGPPNSAQAGLQVTVPDLARFDEVIEALLWAGATDIPLVRFEGRDDAAARRSAIRRATSQARGDAEAMAAAAGGRLGRLVQLMTTPDFDPSSAFVQQAMMAGFRRMPFIPDQLAVRVTVQGHWEFVPGRN